MKILQKHIFKKGTRPELVEGPILSRVEGMSLIEIVIAIAIFSLISAAIASLSLSGMNGLVESADMTRAEALAQEGVEAVKSVRDNAWNTVVGTNIIAASTGNIWSVQSGGPEIILDSLGKQFTRAITLSDVCREIATNTATTTCSGPEVYTDVQSKKVTVNVSWTIREGVNNSVEKVLYVTNWNSKDWLQTDWSGGTGQTNWSDATKYSLGTNVDHSSTGELKLAPAPDGSWINAGGTLVEHTSDSVTEFGGGTYVSATTTGTGVDTSIILTQSPQWSAHADSGASGQNMYGIVMASSTKGWTVGGSNKILVYNGTNWTQEYDPGSNAVNAISLLNTTNIFSAGGSGKIWKNNGSSWSENKDTGSETWNAIDILSTTAGWTVGNSGTVAQYGGGTTWTETTVPSSANMYGVVALTTTNVWACGANGRFWRYTGSWSMVTDTGNENWRAIAANSATSIWAVGDGGKIAYYNGTSWNENIASPTGENLYALHILSASDIWATGSNGIVLHYDGSSWSIQADTGGGENWRGIAMTSATSGFVTGLGGEIFEYTTTSYSPSGTFTSSVIDGGVGSNVWDSVSWTETLPAGSDITIATRSGNTATPNGTWSGWSGGLTDPTGSAIGSNSSRYIQYQISFTRATDTQQTPQLDDILLVFNVPTGQHLRGIDVVSVNDIWAVGNNGVILHYNGSTWASVSSPVGTILYKIDMVSATDGWAVGASGVILHYNGSAWSSFSSPVSNDLNSIHMVSATDGWAVGASGKILHYNGANWSQNMDTGAEVWSTVSMASSTIGFIGGSSVFNMAEYDAAGNTWTEFTGPVSTAIHEIKMFSDGTGWAVGDSGKILYYNGSNWSENLDTGGDSWETVAFASANKGWAFGDANNALKWDGTSWTTQSMPTTQTLYDLATVNTINAWAVGRSGTIIHFDQSALYEMSGTATSSVFDTSFASSSIQVIRWDEDLATSTCPTCLIKFQVRGAATSGGISSAGWIGPDGTAGTFFSTSRGSLIPTVLNEKQYIQYKIDLVGDGDNTPLLREVRINYR
jgi:type II secretory pathway pseudopilin PulG